MIEIKGISKAFSGNNVLNNLVLKVEKGAVLAILGASGCGKTTFLRILAGLEPLDQGEIYKEGRLMSSESICLPPFQRHIGMIFQDLALWPHMCVFDNVAFAAEKLNLSKQTKTELVNKLLNQVHLLKKANSFPSDLSGGERQRLAIVRAIIAKPDILLMDEPFNNIDPITKSEILKLILLLRQDLSMSIVYTTHNFDEILGFANQIVVLHNGSFKKKLSQNEFSHFNTQDLLNWYKLCLAS